MASAAYAIVPHNVQVQAVTTVSLEILKVILVALFIRANTYS